MQLFRQQLLRSQLNHCFLRLLQLPQANPWGLFGAAIVVSRSKYEATIIIVYLFEKYSWKFTLQLLLLKKIKISLCACNSQKFIVTSNRMTKIIFLDFINFWHQKFTHHITLNNLKIIIIIITSYACHHKIKLVVQMVKSLNFFSKLLSTYDHYLSCLLRYYKLISN